MDIIPTNFVVDAGWITAAALTVGVVIRLIIYVMRRRR